MDEDFTYLLQFLKLVESNKYNTEDVDFMLGVVLNMSEDKLEGYIDRTSVESVGNDLIFYINSLMFMIKFYECEESYEQCQLLKEKLNKLKIKTDKNESIKND